MEGGVKGGVLHACQGIDGRIVKFQVWRGGVEAGKYAVVDGACTRRGVGMGKGVRGWGPKAREPPVVCMGVWGGERGGACATPAPPGMCLLGRGGGGRGWGHAHEPPALPRHACADFARLACHAPRSRMRTGSRNVSQNILFFVLALHQAHLLSLLVLASISRINLFYNSNER